jgi:uncharacterized protein YqgV (UPF0045/DUF77 family)
VNVTAEFLVEPFREGALGPHVSAAIDVVEAAGLAVDIGPFGSQVAGPVEVVVPVLAEALRAAVDAGASRVNLTVTVQT